MRYGLDDVSLAPKPTRPAWIFCVNRKGPFVQEEIKLGLDAKSAKAGELAEARPPSASPRICMPTWRNFAKRAYQCGLYEAQDVLVENDDVDLVHLDMSWGAWFKETSLRRPLYHDLSRKLIYANPGLKKVRLTADYDVFIVVCDLWTDIPCINAIERWKDHCRISICWIDEVWAAAIPKYKYWLHALSQFDYVFVGCRGSVSALSQAANRPCHWLPRAVDALQFSPFPTRRLALLTFTVSDADAKASTANCSGQPSEASFSMCTTRWLTQLPLRCTITGNTAISS